MADEPTTPPVPPTMDEILTRMAPTIKESVAEGIRAAVPAPKPAAPAAPPPANPVREIVEEAIGGRLAATELVALAAGDSATFYALTPEVRDPAFRGHIETVEKTFQEHLAQGRYIPRKDLWLHYQGGHFEEIAKLKSSSTQAQQEAALRAAGATGVGVGQAGTVVIQDPYAMTEEQLLQALKDKPF